MSRLRAKRFGGPSPTVKGNAEPKPLIGSKLRRSEDR